MISTHAMLIEVEVLNDPKLHYLLIEENMRDSGVKIERFISLFTNSFNKYFANFHLNNFSGF